MTSFLRMSGNWPDRNYALLKENPHDPSLHLKKIGHFWSVRRASLSRTRDRN
jgi:hypothetical protein